MRSQLLTDMPTANTTSADTHVFLRELLARLGSGEREFDDQSDQIARDLEINDASLWQSLPADSDYHGVTLLVEPVIGALARRTPSAVPDTARRAFLALASRHRQLAVARERCVDRLLTAFAVAGVPLILLKGAALAHLIYPTPELRPMSDIDILIDPADAQAAVKIAERLGYVFAARHQTRFNGRKHHLPTAETTESGFRIALEIHTDTMSPDQPHSLTLSTIAAEPQLIRRGAEADGLALGHTDMLRHLARHAFEPTRQIRLIHLYDLWRYQAIFHDEIEWGDLEARFPYVLVALRLISHVFPTTSPTSSLTRPCPAGIGYGMRPLAEIAAASESAAAKLSALFAPPAWWLHGFYGVPLEQSLFLCKTFRHPAMVARWFLTRFAAGAALPGFRYAD